MNFTSISYERLFRDFRRNPLSSEELWQHYLLAIQTPTLIGCIFLKIPPTPTQDLLQSLAPLGSDSLRSAKPSIMTRF